MKAFVGFALCTIGVILAIVATPVYNGLWLFGALVATAGGVILILTVGKDI